MSDGWVEVPFADVIDFQEGPGIMGRDFREEGIPLVRLAGLERGARSVLDGCNYLDPAEVQRRWAHFALQPGDVLLSTSASLGRIAVVGPDAAGAVAYTGIIRMRPRDGRLSAPFIRYLLEGPEFQRQAEMVGVGSVIRHFGPMHLRQMTVTLPPFHQQRAIAEVLGAIDDKIELNSRMSETLEAIVRALFESWFVDFDPVRAKSVGRDSGLPQPIADLFPNRFATSDLGEIPDGWLPGLLGNIAEHSRRGVAPEEINEGTPYIGLEHMPRRSIALAQWGAADGLASGKSRFDRGEILFGKLRPYFHKVGVAPISGVCSTDIVVVRALTHDWFGLVLGTVSSEAFVAYTNARSTGTKMPRTSWGDMARYPLAVPTTSVARAFNEFAKPMVDRIIAAIHETRTLAEIRDVLLPRLVTGQLRVPQAERLLEAAPA